MRTRGGDDEDEGKAGLGWGLRLRDVVNGAMRMRELGMGWLGVASSRTAHTRRIQLIILERCSR